MEGERQNLIICPECVHLCPLHLHCFEPQSRRYENLHSDDDEPNRVNSRHPAIEFLFAPPSAA